MSNCLWLGLHAGGVTMHARGMTTFADLEFCEVAARRPRRTARQGLSAKYSETADTGNT